MARELTHDSPFFCCRFDPSGRYVFAAAQDSAIQRWQLDPLGEGKTRLAGHGSWVRGLAFHPREPKLFSGDYHGKILCWRYDGDTPTPERTLDAHDGWVRMVAVSHDGRLLASCGNDHLVKLWSTADGSLVRTLRGHESHVYNIAFHPGGEFLVSADHRGLVKQWNIADGREVRTFNADIFYRYDPTFRAGIGGVRGMAFNAHGSLLACSGMTDVTNAFAGIGKPAIVLFNWQSGERQRIIRPQATFQGQVWGVVFHPSGTLIAVGGGRGGALWFCRDDRDAAVHTIAVTGNIYDVDLHPNGRRLAVALNDRKVQIYDC
jgi:WD40 repeat protein